jgi:hypothetical protein
MHTRHRILLQPEAPYASPPGPERPRKRKLLVCEVFYRECCAAAAHSRHAIELGFIEQGLHNKPSGQMCAELQKHVDACTPELYEYVLMAYGLCNNGLAGLTARNVPLVIPKAHDCITLFLGSRARYDEVFKSHPGTYYLTSGWLERAYGEEQHFHDLGGRTDQKELYDEYVRKFGEEDAQYLMDAMGAWQKHYARMLFIDMGLGDHDALVAAAKRHADERGLRLEETRGDPRLLNRLADGPPWDADEFLVVPPKHMVKPSYEAGIIEARPAAT